MSRLAKILLLCFLALPLAAIGFVAGMRFVEPDPALMAAVQQLREPMPPVRGRDGSDAVWLLDYALPTDAQAEASAAAQLRQYERARALAAPGAPALPDPRAAWTRFPEQPPEEQGVCSTTHAGCLAYVEANRPLVAATLAEHEAGLAKALAFADYDGVRVGVLPSLEAPLPNVGGRRRLVLTSFARRYVAGERLGAVSALCRDLGGWRRLGADTDNLLVSMVGVAFVKQDLWLLAEMLAKLPKETEIPNECTQALRASTPDELDLCPAVRTEFGTVAQAPDAMDRGQKGWLRPSRQLDRRNYEALLAGSFARFCAEPVRKLALADQPVGPAVPPAPRCSRWRRYADPVGCVLAESGSMDGHDRYLDRRTDQAAMLALMRTIVWLRTNAASPDAVEGALANRPDELGLRRAPRYLRERDALAIDLLEHSKGPEFVLAAGAEPLPVKRRVRPGSRRPSARNLAAL